MIPSQLESEEPTFLRIAERSKAPERGNSAKTGPFYHASDSELIAHLGSGGNIGRVLRDDLVAFDVDTQRLDELLENDLGSTFTVESGGTGFGFHRYYRCSEWDTNHIQFSDDGVNLGSLRSGNSYCLAPPSEHDETRDRYTVSDDRQIRSVSAGSLKSIVSELKSQHQPGGAAALVLALTVKPTEKEPMNQFRQSTRTETGRTLSVSRFSVRTICSKS